MSNFSDLKNMWQSKGKVTVNPPPPIKPLPQKIKPPVAKQQPSPVLLMPPPPQNNVKRLSDQPPNNRQSQQQQITRKSVAQLKNNLQGKIKFGVGPYGIQKANSYSSQPSSTSSNEQYEPKPIPIHCQTEKQVHQMPTFEQSKANLQKIFQRKKNQKQGYHTGPTPQQNQATSQNQGFIDLKTEQQSQKLTPQQRTQQVIKRIFSTPQKNQNSNYLKIPNNPANQRQTYLNKQEVAQNLNTRGSGSKKSKKDLGDFDDA